MHAIIKTGGKQYRVAIGDIIDVELLSSDSKTVEFEALFFNDGSTNTIGAPTIPNFLVHGEILGQVSGVKGKGLKYKRSHNECRQWGYRQKYTRLQITAIGSHRKNKEG
ncbi:MAG: 50S ribosomal protein L21 [Parachlamydiaceae bacterium]|nr:50S ribosomal protein L21 [Parachlamydiaceae bacterium]